MEKSIELPLISVFADEDEVVSSVLLFGVVCSIWLALDLFFVLHFSFANM